MQGLGSGLEHGWTVIAAQSNADFTMEGNLLEDLHKDLVRIRAPMDSASFPRVIIYLSG